MPYLRKKDRDFADEFKTPILPGELNYLITRLCLKYVQIHDQSYTTFNEVMGALECAKQEFYRRAIVPYEEYKLRQNGDVYEDLSRSKVRAEGSPAPSPGQAVDSRP